MTGHNPMTRALISAMRSGIPPLCAQAIFHIDEAVRLSDSHRPELALQLAFDASLNTAKRLLAERENFTKRGLPRHKKKRAK